MSEEHKFQLERRERIALQMAPAFIHKYDYSRPEDYEGLAQHAFVAADAFIKKCDALLMAAKAKDDAASLAKKMEAEMEAMQKNKGATK